MNYSFKLQSLNNFKDEFVFTDERVSIEATERNWVERLRFRQWRKEKLPITDEQSPGSANVMNISTCKRPEELGRGMVSVRHWLNGSHGLAAALWGFSDNRRWRKPSTVICLLYLLCNERAEKMKECSPVIMGSVCSRRAKTNPPKQFYCLFKTDSDSLVLKHSGNLSGCWNSAALFFF